uniref:Uncharacterized protein n=1 Tax=Aegilops tauschii subsp. strangulata TaxID=200361 RepID=A0A453LUJ7_AEGTS
METDAPAAGREAKESPDLAPRVPQILGAGLDRHTQSRPMALRDRSATPVVGALARDLSRAAPPTAAPTRVVPKSTPRPSPTTGSLPPLRPSPVLSSYLMYRSSVCSRNNSNNMCVFT